MLSGRFPRWMNVKAFGCTLWVLGAILGAQSLASAQNTQKAGRSTGAVYPGAAWQKADPRELGWSLAKLEKAHEFFIALPPASVMVIDHGRVVAEWGDPTLRVKL